MKRRSAPPSKLVVSDVRTMSNALVLAWVGWRYSTWLVIVGLAGCSFLCLARAKGMGLHRTVAADPFSARFSPSIGSVGCRIFDFARSAGFLIATVVAAALADFAATIGSVCSVDRSSAGPCLFSAVANAEVASVFACDVSSIARSSFLLLPNLLSQLHHLV